MVGPWWGLARRDLRRRGAGSGEEIGAVVCRDQEVTVAGDCRWQSRPVGSEALAGLLEGSLPALREAGTAAGPVRIVLFSKSGFEPDLVAEASARSDVDLVDLPALLEGVSAG